MKLRSLQQLEVNWVREIYIVSKETMDIADHHRKCWICGEPFKVGDGMTVAGTSRGNKLMHTRCQQAQVPTDAESGSEAETTAQLAEDLEDYQAERIRGLW